MHRLFRQTTERPKRRVGWIAISRKNSAVSGGLAVGEPDEKLEELKVAFMHKGALEIQKLNVLNRQN